MKNSGNIFLGVLGAATAGVIVGMLIAPKKGDRLRKSIKKNATGVAKKLAKLIDKGKARYEELKASAMSDADELKHTSNGTHRKAKSSV